MKANSALLKEMAEAAQKATFVISVYKPVAMITLEEYAKTFDNRYKEVDTTIPLVVMFFPPEDWEKKIKGKTDDEIEKLKRLYMKVRYTSKFGDTLDIDLSTHSTLEEDDTVECKDCRFVYFKSLNGKGWKVCDPSCLDDIIEALED